MLSPLYCAILVILLLISGAYGHPLTTTRDITESNNNLLNWWIATSSSGELPRASRLMDSPEGAGYGSGVGKDEDENGLDVEVLDDELLQPELEDLSRSNQAKQKWKSADGLNLLTRRKKGLSYLSKFYSDSLHNNHGNFGNSSGSSKEAQYFGEKYGQANEETGNDLPALGIYDNVKSGEHSRFPSNVRRRLSFYPPLTLMTPWRSIGGIPSGRSSSLRLRWGK